uniref:Envelope protein n=1 Tax=Chionoecetes opilio bacilliform virus TaxID=1825681 RepID=A0A1Q3DKX9_9VIRU|nr:envelope protein [Chionoecetes opilio bacilliform virus]
MVVLMACVVAIMCAAVAFSLTKSISVNASIIQEMRMRGKLKAVSGADPNMALAEYLKIKRRLTHVDDASSFPPHPSIDNLMGLASEENPWGIPSETAERSMWQTATASEINSLHIPQHQRSRVDAATHDQVDKYLGAILGKKIRNRVMDLREKTQDDPNTKTIFESVFGNNDNALHSSVYVSDDIPAASTDAEIMAFGHCSLPVKAVTGKTCAQTCLSSTAVRIKTPFIAGGSWVTADEGDTEDQHYCWAGKTTTLQLDDTPNTSIERLLKPCSLETSNLVLTDDGGWQCRPQYPTYFGGPDGTVKTACAFNSSVHKGPSSVYNSNVTYVDEVTKHPIMGHGDLHHATFLKLLRASKSITRYKYLATDPDLLFKYPIVCECGAQRDTLNNALLSTDDRKVMKFTGMYQCVGNPCFMVPDISNDFGIFNAAKGTCTKLSSALENTVNVVLGDERTPLAGVVPAMGLVIADHTKRPDNILNLNGSTNYDESTAQIIGCAASPVLTASQLDASNASRNILYVPIPSINLPRFDDIDTVVIRPSSIMHLDCLPPLLVKPSSASDRPFCTAAFYVEPAANVTAGHVPQKPYEHNLLATECLRNSRMISGNVHGGSEILYSTLLAHDSVSHNGVFQPVIPTLGDTRLEDIRDFFNRNFNNSRRLSTFEYLMKRQIFSGSHTATDAQLDAAGVYDKFSMWDKNFRRKDFNRTGIEEPRNSFVIREGLLLRSFGPYAATVLAPDSFDFKYMRGEPDAETSSTVKMFNPLQMAFPTSHSILPAKASTLDIFSTDTTRVFDGNIINSFFNSKAENDIIFKTKLFPDTPTNLKQYRVDSDDNAWGLQTFRLDYNPQTGPAVSSDPRLVFDMAHIDATPDGATLTPLSLFKKTPLEWGHKEVDLQHTDWFGENIDTSVAYRRFLIDCSIVLRTMWFSSAWETADYFYTHNDD